MKNPEIDPLEGTKRMLRKNAERMVHTGIEEPDGEIEETDKLAEKKAKKSRKRARKGKKKKGKRVKGEKEARKVASRLVDAMFGGS